MLRPRRNRIESRRARGLGIVELMIGLALGLFVVGGGLLMLAGFTDENRRLLLETRLNQDLRAASDVVTRDLRRAGYWSAAHSGVWATGGPAVPPQNPYSRMDGTACAAANLNQTTTTVASTALCYAIEATVDATPGAIDANERFGFELDAGVIYTVADGGARQALTDPKSIAISDLVITPSSQVLDASGYCKTACNPAAAGANCPQVVVREYEVLIKGNLPGDATINRFLRSNVRIRNDHFGGQCPA